MPEGDIETYHLKDEGVWRNRTEGGQDFDGDYRTREEAVEVGRELAREFRVEHIIRRTDGTIGERNSHGNDPRDIPG